MAEEITAILQQLLSFISFLQPTQVRFNKWKYISLNNRRFITLNHRRVNIFANVFPWHYTKSSRYKFITKCIVVNKILGTKLLYKTQETTFLVTETSHVCYKTQIAMYFFSSHLDCKI